MAFSRLKQWAVRNLPYLSAALGGRAPLRFVESIDVEPIAACNLKCPFCQVPGWERAKTTRAMEMPLFQKVVDQFPNLRHVKLQGMGEPLMNQRIPDMVGHLAGRGIKSSIITNAVFLRPPLSDRLLEKGLTTLTVSFDGGTKETYEKARVRAGFERVTGNLKAFCAARNAGGFKTEIGVVCLVSAAEIMEELPDLVRLASDMGVDWLHVKSRIKIWAHDADMDSYSYKSVQLAEQFDAATRVAAEAESLARELGVKFTFSEDSRYTAESHCPWPWTSLYVSTEGKIVPCCVVGIPECWSMGDLNDQGLAQIWNSPDYRALRKKLVAGEFNSYCRECYRN